MEQGGGRSVLERLCLRAIFSEKDLDMSAL